MNAQKGVAPHLRKKTNQTKSISAAKATIPASNDTAKSVVPSDNTAHSAVPDIQALSSIARAVHARKSTGAAAIHDTDHDAPVKRTRIVVDPSIFADDCAPNFDTDRDSNIDTTTTNATMSNAPSVIADGPTLQSTSANAVVLYGVQQNLSPMEMIQHETVRTLQSLLDDAQAQLEAANARCNKLSAENEDLRRQISEGVQGGEQAETSGILGDTLVGHESSEEAEEEVVSDGKHHCFSFPYTTNQTTDPSTDSSTQALRSANERLDTVTQILELQNSKQADFESAMAKQAERIDALQRRIDEDKKIQTSEPKESICPIDYRQLVARISALEKNPATSKSTQNAISALQARMELSRRQRERIDNAVIREDLLSFYAILSDQISGFHDFQDGFKGNEDELWALRERVLRRLSSFTEHGEALAEAKAAMEYNGRGKGSPGSGKGSVSGSAGRGSKSRW